MLRHAYNKKVRVSIGNCSRVYGVGVGGYCMVCGWGTEVAEAESIQ